MNIDEDVKLVPADGLYAVNIHLEGKIMKGMFCINNNQIVNGLNNPNLELEFHCLCQNSIKEGKSLLTYFHKRIRSSKIYQDEEGMKGQVEKDIREIEELIF